MMTNELLIEKFKYIGEDQDGFPMKKLVFSNKILCSYETLGQSEFYNSQVQNIVIDNVALVYATEFNENDYLNIVPNLKFEIIVTDTETNLKYKLIRCGKASTTDFIRLFLERIGD